MTTHRKRTIGQRIADYIARNKKAIAAGVSQLVTTAIAWVGLHSALDVDPATATWLAATVGAAVSSGIVWLARNELS